MDSNDSLKETGRCAAAALVEMVAALECDYDRLEELDSEELNDDINNLIESPEATELVELREAAGECKDADEASERIQEDALEVVVRGDWCPAGDQERLGAPVEFKILLATGGPAARIMGELDESCEPVRAWLEVQDWGTPWTQYFDIEQDTLLAYARCFYFGEG